MTNSIKLVYCFNMIKQIESGVSAKTLDNDYLFSIRDYALELGLVGVVFIKNDGSLKIIAEGAEEILEKFAKELRKGNYFPVENFYLLWHESVGNYKDFSVVYSK